MINKKNQWDYLSYLRKEFYKPIPVDFGGSEEKYQMKIAIV